ncbi:baseplate J/gp47 family protein [Georgenia subflava]|uniref:Putative baseplate assembly protein n=1 Tax=Georgenia subflava TaxID=1622177 RepID=A0A6N7EKI3_9MICO|nr:putative baseplate assembly protein [Georgenia subflava]MPV37317.1 putative baseplate assembly protein [Georgenia subflava]
MSAAPPTTFGADVDRAARRRLVLGVTGGPGDLEGIDFVEVLANAPGTPGHVPGAPRQRTLLVHLLKRDVPAGWDAARVAVVGGVRHDPAINPVRVAWAAPADEVVGDGAPPPPEAPWDALDQALVTGAVPADDRGGVLVVRTTSSGDRSGYVLRLLGADGTGHPEGFDAVLAEAPVVFSVDCPSDLDCAVEPSCPPEAVTSPLLDYLARDYDALRGRLLDRFASLVPGWDDRNPADVAVMVMELFAHLGDRLATWQDAVAEEAYLGRARLRTSVHRHARLLDYRVHEGCAARVLLALTTDTDVTLPAGTPVADSVLDPAAPPAPVDAAEAGAVVVQTAAGARLRAVRNAIALYPWGDPAHCLPVGATTAFLAAEHGATGPALARGDLLVLADTTRGTLDGHGDPGRRHAVRLDRDPVPLTDEVTGVAVLQVHWAGGDALPHPLVVSEPGPDGGPVVRAVALANVVLADHGATVPGEDLVEGSRPRRARLARTGLTFADPVRLDPPVASAAELLSPDPARAAAQLVLDDGRRRWEPRPDLLASDRLAAHVVAEPDDDGVTWLRFGDGVTGRRPSGAPMRAWYRIGGGSRGNVAADRLVHLLPRADGSPPVPSGAAVTVRNPLPATGGTDPQPLAEVRELAPLAFRAPLRAVTSSDYAATAMLDPGLQRAVARRRWTGSWYAQEVTIDPVAARTDDPGLRESLRAVLEGRRMAGVDVTLAGPVHVPLLIVLQGCAAPGHHRTDVEAGLRQVFSAGVRPDGRPGFFHPDAFTFGQPLFLSDVVAAAMAVTGLSWVEVTTFARLDAPEGSATALAAGRLAMAPREVLRCDTDPDNPEMGRVEVRVGEGR